MEANINLTGFTETNYLRNATVLFFLLQKLCRHCLYLKQHGTWYNSRTWEHNFSKTFLKCSFKNWKKVMIKKLWGQMNKFFNQRTSLLVRESTCGCVWLYFFSLTEVSPISDNWLNSNQSLPSSIIPLPWSSVPFRLRRAKCHTHFLSKPASST